MVRRHHQLQEHDQSLQQRDRPALRPCGDRAPDRPAGADQGRLQGRRGGSLRPIPTAPASPYAPADASAAPYPYNPEKAVAILKEHGWKVVPGGQTTCEKPGSGASECGEGIPAGTPLAFTWANQPKSVSSTGVLESEALASKAKEAAGITITLQTKTFNFLTSNYNNQNPEAAKYTNEWGVNNYGGVFMDYYPTQLRDREPRRRAEPGCLRRRNGEPPHGSFSPQRKSLGGQGRGLLHGEAPPRPATSPTRTTCWPSTKRRSADRRRLDGHDPAAVVAAVLVPDQVADPVRRRSRAAKRWLRPLGRPAAVLAPTDARNGR